MPKIPFVDKRYFGIWSDLTKFQSDQWSLTTIVVSYN